jgi:hypothetical protein
MPLEQLDAFHSVLYDPTCNFSFTSVSTSLPITSYTFSKTLLAMDNEKRITVVGLKGLG